MVKLQVMPKKVKFQLGSSRSREKIEKLEAVLQQKTAQVHKLERIHRVLAEREQVGSPHG